MGTKVRSLKSLNTFNRNVSAQEAKAGIIQKNYKVYRPEGFIVCFVEYDKLETDDHQRTPDRKHIKAIDDNYDTRYVDMPICTCRPNSDGTGKLTVYVEDHNHTRTVMARRDDLIELPDGRKVIECLVHFGMDQSEAAKLFNAKNTSSKKVESWKSFHAGYIGGRKCEEEILDSARRHKLSTAIDPTTKNGVPCLMGETAELILAREYVKVYEKYGLKFLDSIFELHRRCFRGKTMKLAFFRAIVNVSQQNDMAPIELFSYFRGHSMDSIMGDARALSVRLGKNRTESVISTVMGRLIQSHYRQAA